MQRVIFVKVLFILMVMPCLRCYSQVEAYIRITEKPIERDYVILFSCPQEVDVNIRLVDGSDQVLVDEDFPGTKTFAKIYSLNSLNYGNYTWEVRYDNKTFTQEIQIQSEKKLIKESISATMDDLLNLTIEVKPYNTLPLSIFLYNGLGDQLTHIFWEPEGDQRTKTINLANYDAYEFRLEILQRGEPAFEETFSTF